MRPGLIALLVVALPGAAFAQAPTGPEFQVNSVAAGSQIAPAVATDAGGNYVVVWQGPGQGGSQAVSGRRFDVGGGSRGSDFEINSSTSSRQARAAVALDTNGNASGAAVAADGAGNFVVVWSDDARDGSGSGVFARRFDAGGVASGEDFQVNTATGGPQQRAATAASPAGDVVVVWESDGQDGSGNGVFGQLLDPGGARKGDEFAVNATTDGAQEHAAVAMDAAGSFVVVWDSDSSDGSGKGIVAQRFDAGGARQGDEIKVNSFTTGDQTRPAVASDGAGNFVVVWQSASQDGSGNGIFGQRFDASGTPLGDLFAVNTTTAGEQTDPAIAADPGGAFQVVWVGADASGRGVFGRRFDPAGAAQGAEFALNSFTTGDQSQPRVAPSAGSFIVVWQSDGQDGSGATVVGRR